MTNPNTEHRVITQRQLESALYKLEVDAAIVETAHSLATRIFEAVVPDEPRPSNDRLALIRAAVARDGSNLEAAYADRAWLLSEVDRLQRELDGFTPMTPEELQAHARAATGAVQTEVCPVCHTVHDDPRCPTPEPRIEPRCPRPCNGRPDEWTMAQCILAGECGCTKAACDARAAGETRDDYKSWYEDAMSASNEAGYIGVSAADTIRDLNRQLCETKRQRSAVETPEDHCKHGALLGSPCKQCGGTAYLITVSHAEKTKAEWVCQECGCPNEAKVVDCHNCGRSKPHDDVNGSRCQSE